MPGRAGHGVFNSCDVLGWDEGIIISVVEGSWAVETGDLIDHAVDRGAVVANGRIDPVTIDSALGGGREGEAATQAETHGPDLARAFGHGQKVSVASRDVSD